MFLKHNPVKIRWIPLNILENFSVWVHNSKPGLFSIELAFRQACIEQKADKQCLVV